MLMSLNEHILITWLQAPQYFLLSDTCWTFCPSELPLSLQKAASLPQRCAGCLAGHSPPSAIQPDLPLGLLHTALGRASRHRHKDCSAEPWLCCRSLQVPSVPCLLCTSGQSCKSQ